MISKPPTSWPDTCTIFKDLDSFTTLKLLIRLLIAHIHVLNRHTTTYRIKLIKTGMALTFNIGQIFNRATDQLDEFGYPPLPT